MIEYKTVSGPADLSVSSMTDKSAAKAVAKYADIINKEAIDGWKLFSIESISVTKAPGCFSFTPSTALINMIIFSRETEMGKIE